MATIIDLGDGRFIAGEPDTELHEGNRWCEYCNGDGLEYGYYEADTGTCSACMGVGQVKDAP